MEQNTKEYWQKHIKLILILISICFFTTFGLLLSSNILNEIDFFGVKLGYFIANQGLILFFILIIYIYIKQISKLDKKYSIRE